MLAIIIYFCQISIFQEVEKGLDKVEKVTMLQLNAKKIFTWYTHFFFVIETTHILYRDLEKKSL